MIKEENRENHYFSLRFFFTQYIFHLSELGDEMQIDQGENHNQDYPPQSLLIRITVLNENANMSEDSERDILGRDSRQESMTLLLFHFHYLPPHPNSPRLAIHYLPLFQYLVLCPVVSRKLQKGGPAQRDRQVCNGFASPKENKPKQPLYHTTYYQLPYSWFKARWNWNPGSVLQWIL